MDWFKKLVGSKSKTSGAGIEPEVERSILDEVLELESDPVSKSNFEESVEIDILSQAGLEIHSEVEIENRENVEVASTPNFSPDSPDDYPVEAIAVLRFDGAEPENGNDVSDKSVDEFPEIDASNDDGVDPSEGFEKDPFSNVDIEDLSFAAQEDADLGEVIAENPDSVETWEQMGDALDDENIMVQDRAPVIDWFASETVRMGSAIRWTDGLANPIMWSLQHDWTPREISTVKDFLSKLARTVENRGVLLDADNIKAMTEVVTEDNLGRTMYLLSEPWMSRKKLKAEDAMSLASKMAPKIVNSLTFEALAKAGLSKSFASSRVEFESKLGEATRSELQHVVEILRTFKTPLAYTMATSLDYVCACLGDRAAMVRVSDAIELLLDQDLFLKSESLYEELYEVHSNWLRYAHAYYFKDNSYVAFEERFALETIDLTGKTGDLEFDECVALPEPIGVVNEKRLIEFNRKLKSGAFDKPKSSPPDNVIPGFRQIDFGTVGTATDDLLTSLAKAHKAGDAEEAYSVFASDPNDDSIRIRVLDRIGGGDVSSAAEKNYSHLLRPLPIIAAPDPDDLYSKLMAEFPWMAEANEFVARAAALGSRQLGRGLTIPPLLLNGPSGVGKTRWIRRVAKLSSVPMHWTSFAGIENSKSVMGNERGWANARPSLPTLALAATQVVNPIIMVDELDKANSTHNGDPFSALLPMLAKETHAQYPDVYLMGFLNLSYASFMFTSNSIAKLSNELKDRLEVFNVPRPTMKEYPIILNNIILEAGQEAFLDLETLEAMRPELTDLGMEAFGRGDSIRKVERVIADAVGKHVWKPKPFLTVVK